jgi:hypothetical protein
MGSNERDKGREERNYFVKSHGVGAGLFKVIKAPSFFKLMIIIC